jgi:hypothetical protein
MQTWGAVHRWAYPTGAAQQQAAADRPVRERRQPKWRNNAARVSSGASSGT